MPEPKANILVAFYSRDGLTPNPVNTQNAIGLKSTLPHRREVAVRPYKANQDLVFVSLHQPIRWCIPKQSEKLPGIKGETDECIHSSACGRGTLLVGNLVHGIAAHSPPARATADEEAHAND